MRHALSIAIVIGVAACSPAVGEMANGPEGVKFCGGDAVQREISYTFLNEVADGYDVAVTVNGADQRAMSAFSYFGNAEAPEGFVVALLAEDRGEFLVFDLGIDGGGAYIEYGDYTYRPCE